MSDQPFEYAGGELDLFAAAPRWKEYLRREIEGFLGPRVLEVGAGIGSTTRTLCNERHARWLCLEPDARQADVIRRAAESRSLPSCCEVLTGSLDDQDPGLADTILYVDVLEHIDDDALELAKAARHLAPGGFLVVLSPAHPSLYSPFDEALGHFRRYTRRSLSAVAPPILRLVRLGDSRHKGPIARSAPR